jgi:hypothetical protein
VGIVFDQPLNTTDSPSFAGLTTTSGTITFNSGFTWETPSGSSNDVRFAVTDGSSVFDIYSYLNNSSPVLRIGGTTPSVSAAMTMRSSETGGNTWASFGDKDTAAVFGYGVGGSVARASVHLVAAAFLGWTDRTAVTDPDPDVRLYRDGSDILAQRHGTTAQEARIYNTWTDASNGEWLSIGYKNVTNEAFIKVDQNGTGVQRKLQIDGGGDRVGIFLGGTHYFNLRNTTFEPKQAGIRLATSVDRFTECFLGGNTVTSSTPMLDLSHTNTATSGTMIGSQVAITYNQTGTAGSTDLLINRTDTAIGSGLHYFADFQVGGVSKFRVNRIGDITTAGSDINFGGGTVGRLTAVGDDLQLQAQGDKDPTLYMRKGVGAFEFSSNDGNFYLYPEAANTLALRNSTNPQEIRIYGDYQDASNYQRLFLRRTSGERYWIGTEFGGTGVKAGLTLGSSGSGGNADVRIAPGGTEMWEFDYNSQTLHPTTNGQRGIGQASFRVSQYFGGGNTVTASTPIIDGTQTDTASSGTIVGMQFAPTHNQSGTAGTTNLLINRTETALGSGSHYFADYQVNSSSVAYLKNNGDMGFENWQSPSRNIEIVPAASRWAFGQTGFGERIRISVAADGGLGLSANHKLSWSNTADNSGATEDTILYRDAAATLALRNSTNAQSYRIYNTYTDASNNEYLSLDWSTTANTATIGTVANGTGTKRNLIIDADTKIQLYSGNAIDFSSTGLMTFHSGRIIKTTTNNQLRLQDTMQSSTANPIVNIGKSSTLNGSSGVQGSLEIESTYNQTSTAGSTDLLINRTETALGSGSHYFADFQVGGTSKILIDNTGTIEPDKTTADEGFINFKATADADSTSAISTLTTSGSTTHHIQVEINGTKAWIAASTNAPT